MARRCLSTMGKKSMCCACYADDVRKETCEDDATLTKTGGERVHASSTVHGQAVKEGEARHAELPLAPDIVQGGEAALLVEVPRREPKECTRKSARWHIDHGGHWQRKDHGERRLGSAGMAMDLFLAERDGGCKGDGALGAVWTHHDDRDATTALLWLLVDPWSKARRSAAV